MPTEDVIESAQDGQLQFLVLVTLTQDGVECVDLVYGLTRADVETKGLEHLVETATRIVEQELGEGDVEPAEIGAEIAYDSETDVYKWGNLKTTGWELRLMPCDEEISAIR